MREINRKRVVAVLVAMAVFLGAGSAIAQDFDIKILRKALRNALGERTNAGTKRLIALRRELKEDRDTLIVGVIANNSPTPAGFRHGILVDVAKILGILKDWDWPSKIDRVLIGEYSVEPKGGDLEAHPVFVCSVSSETMKRIDWNAVDPDKVIDVVDEAEIDHAIE